MRAGRTARNWKGFRHILEADPEPSLKQLAQTVTGQVGGLSYRSSPTGWKQAQGSVGNMQAALHAQIRTLIADVQSRYGDVETSVHSPLYPWTLRHAEWLSNRYLQKSDRLTAYTSKDGTLKCHGSVCNFGEALMFRVANVGKAQLSWRDGIWLGCDTESDMHSVPDSSGVFMTRSIRRHIPSRQSSLELLQSITATPWDPTGSKRDADAFILPLSKGGPQPWSEGASKEDFAAEEPVDDYIEPERAHFQMTWLTCRLKGAKWHFRRRHFLRCHVFRRHSQVSPDDGSFHFRPRVDPAATLERRHEHEPEEAGPGSKM